MVTDKTTENLAALVEAAEDAPVEGGVGTVIEKGDTPMAIASMQSAGYVYVYDRKTGDRSVVNRNMLQKQLQKRHPETDELAFTTIDPGFRPPKGDLVCWLHQDSPKREIVTRLGLPENACIKSGFFDEYGVSEHVRLRHRRTYSSVREYEDRQREEDRDRIQRELLERAMGIQNTPASVIASATPEAPVTAVGLDDERLEEILVPEPVDESKMVKCDVCGEEYEIESPKVAGVRKAQHNRTHKEQ